MYFGLLRTLHELKKSKKTGLLEVQGDGVRARFYIAMGNVVFADEGTVGETLGRILTREKVLEESDYERVLEEMAHARTAGLPARFGEVVVRLGILTQAQVDTALAAQVQHKLLKALKWQEAKYDFVSRPLPPEVARFPTDIEPIVIRALRVVPEEGKQELLFDKQNARPKLELDIGRVTALFALKTPEARFVSLMDGTRTMAELLDASLPDAVDPELLLCALTLTEHISWKSDPSASAAPPAPFVSKRKRREKEPPSTKRVRRSALKSKVLRLTTTERKRVKQAAHRLRAKSATPAPMRQPVGSMVEIGGTSEQGARLMAEQHYRRGRQCLRENNVADALTSLKRAVDLVPDATEYRLYAVWAASRLLPEREGDRLAALRAIARRAIKEDPDFGFAYYVLGHVAMREGHRDEARELLDRARSLDVNGIEGEKPLRIAHVLITQKVRVPEIVRATALSPPFSMRAADEILGEELAAFENDPTIAATTPMQAPALPSVDIGATTPTPVVQKTTPAPAAKLMDPPDDDGPERTIAMEGRPIPPSPAIREAAPQAAPSGRVTGEPVAATDRVTAKKRSGGKSALFGIALAVGICAIGAFFAKNRLVKATATSSTTSTPTTTSTTTTTTTASTTTTATSTTATTATSTTATTATSTSPSTPTPSSSLDPTPSSSSPNPSASSSSPAHTGTGTLLAPSWARGRRIFVDGKSVGEGPTIEVACGSRVVQVGSAGKPKTIDVPCGGKIEL